MRIKIFLKRLVSISVSAILAVTLVGCFDLGDYSDEAAYYEAFGDVKLVYQNPTVVEKDVENEDYSIKDYFYNKNTGEDFAYGDPKDDDPDEGKDIPQLPYLYMAIPAERNLKIESLALYFNAQQTCSLKVSFYVVDNLPDDGSFTNIRLLGEPEYQQKLDEEGNPVTDEKGETVYEAIPYSDPDENSKVGQATVHVKNGEWVSLLIDNWNSEKSVQVNQSQFLLLRFMDNGGTNTTGDPSVAFRVTNLLIRAIS